MFAARVAALLSAVFAARVAAVLFVAPGRPARVADPDLSGTWLPVAARLGSNDRLDDLWTANRPAASSGWSGPRPRRGFAGTRPK